MKNDNSNGTNWFIGISNKRKGSVTFTCGDGPDDITVTISDSLGEGVARNLVTFTIVADGTSRSGLVNILNKCNGFIESRLDDIDYYTILNGLKYVLHDKEIYSYDGTERFNIKNFYIMEPSTKKMIKLF